MCDKLFSNHQQRKRHERLSHGERKSDKYGAVENESDNNEALIESSENQPFSYKSDGENTCKECGKFFATISGLQKHIQSSHDGIKHHCSHCDAKYSHKWTLNNHIKAKHE